MVSTLELLTAEQEAQTAEEARPPFENISLEMCLLGSVECDNFFRAELINRDDETEFEAIQQSFKTIDPARRSKYIFTSTSGRIAKRRWALSTMSGFQLQIRKVLAVGDADNQAPGEVIQSDPDAQMTLERQPEISPSATLVSAKRMDQMGSLQDEVGDPMLGSPTKRTRKGCSRELPPGKESKNSQ
ncbi:hypothetical protein JG688_00016074 [Phytophthora aleatoria]|uniref:Uncharacterized protein n=1 Tax=Phytophthora aleatoria TaxID=2496075 RepID=A0A8J5IGN2_9STRA|nr:hypothetical protein JG688_00016074 [Phytophthora aleatoria]